jgi:TonB-linked SusC/RagA family outer membrane protein
MQNKFASGSSLSENFRKKFSNILNITALFLIVTAFSATAVASDATTVAQKIKVSGTVVSSEDNQPLPGVNIRIANTNSGTTTGIDGKYSLELADPNTTLVFSYIGYVAEEVEVAGRSVIDVALVPDISRLEEVVVIGYGSTAKKNVASATTALKSDDIVGLSTSDVRQTMQGKIAGVQVTNNSGDPGSGARVVIRGMGSFTNTDPLYVIDGIQGGDINSVAPQTIESITILKDASTTAIYGSAAANGVVLITTKSGQKGALKVGYDGSIGVAKVTKRLDMLNASQYVDLVQDIQDANNALMTPDLLSDYAQVDRTDWQEEVFQKGLVTDHNLRFTGGTDNVTYAFSTGYQNEESTVIDRNFQRITFGAKLSENLFNNRLRLNQNLRIRSDINSGNLANFNDALRMPPYIPVEDPTVLGGYGRADKVRDLNDANNPWNTVKNSDYQSRDLGIDVDLGAELEIMKGLTFKTQARLTAANEHHYTYNYPVEGGNFTRLTANMNEYFEYRYGVILENFFNYSKTFGVHDISATLGNTYNPSDRYQSLEVNGSDYTSDAIQNVALANSASIATSNLNSQKARSSYFGRVGYTFNEKYVINASLRRDASSVFGINNRWGTFYGIGVAWSVSREQFMSTLPSVSNLKLRASFGVTGNDNIPPFLTTSNVWKGDGNNIVYSFGDDLSYSNGSTINSVANPDLKWEQTDQFDVGFDLGLFNNNISFVFDYYHRNNKDLLIEVLLPLTTGLGNPGSQATQWVNAASMKNSGFEAALGYTSRSSVIRWDASVNATYSINEVNAMGTPGDLPISKGEFQGGIGNSTRTYIGHPLASYYGYKVDHVAVDQAEVDQLNAAAFEASAGEVTEYKAGLQPGHFIWKDIDGNGYLDDKDRTYIGNPSPKWQYGAVFNAFYKNFDFQLMVHGVAGVEVVNGARYWWEGMTKPFNNTTTVLRRWQQEGDVTDVPKAGQSISANLLFSDWYVEKGDYLRVKNISIGYTLPSSFLKNTFDKFRIYAAIQNALTLTKYSGFDPEISSGSPDDNDNYIFQRGIDVYNRPNPRIIRLGLQINF